MTQHPVDELKSEHRLIEEVLVALDERLSAPGAFPADFVEQALDFFANFADGLHHYKEEIALFPVMIESGVPQENGPIGCMLKEHETGRNYLRAIRQALPAARLGDASAQQQIRTAAGGYIHLLKDHIWKEDNILFEIARRVMDQTARDRVETEFRNEQNPRIAPEVREKYEAFVRGLNAPVR